MSPDTNAAGAGPGSTRSGGGPSAGHACARSTRSGTRARAGCTSARSTGPDATARGARFGRRRPGRRGRRAGRRRDRCGNRRGRRVFAVVAGAACRGQRTQGDCRGDASGDGNAARNSNIGHVSSQSLRVGPTFSVHLPSACRFQAYVRPRRIHTAKLPPGLWPGRRKQPPRQSRHEGFRRRRPIQWCRLTSALVRDIMPRLV